MSVHAIPLATLSSNQMTNTPTVIRTSKPDKLNDTLMYLAREAFMPKNALDPKSRTLNQYLKEELSLLGKNERTKTKTAELTAKYNGQVEKLTNDYMIYQVGQLWSIIKDCVGVTLPASRTKRICYKNPQTYAGEVGIKAFMDELKKHALRAKAARGLLAHHVVNIYKIEVHLDEIARKLPGKTVFFTRDYPDIETGLSWKNYEKLFPNQKYCNTIVRDQIDQLEAAILDGKDHTDEAILPEVANFQVEHAARRQVIPMPNFFPAITGNSVYQTSGMGLNTAWTPGGNAPVMVPTYSMSNNPGGLAFGYQAPL